MSARASLPPNDLFLGRQDDGYAENWENLLSCDRDFEPLAAEDRLPEVVDLPPEALRRPRDMVLANEVFGANCGPGALAAALSLEALNVMQFFSHFPERTFTSALDMREVLRRCQLQNVECRDIPDFGLVLVQFLGPWMNSRASERWSGRYRHWIAVCEEMIYDVNFDGWVRRLDWESQVVEMFRTVWPGVNGWQVRRGFRIPPQRFFQKKVVQGLFL